MATTSSLRPNAEDLWTTAVKTLSEQDKTTLNLDRPDRLRAIAECLELTDKARNQCTEKAWRFRRKSGEEVVARDVLAKVARWIHHFTAVGDTLVQYNPAHAALPWASVRFVLQVVLRQVCVDYFETHNFLLEKIPHIAEQICRCELIEKHLIRFLSSAVVELKRALVILYAAILTFLAQVKTYFQRTTKSTLEHISTQFDGAFQNIIAAQADMERCLNMANTQEQLNRLTTLKDDLAQLKRPMARWSNELAKVTDGLERSKKTEILRWILGEPYGKHHKRECETFLKGTGEWLISHPIFQQWKDESASALLWLHGIPGSGKTPNYSRSLVIENAIKAFQKQQAPSPAYFYCFRNPAELKRSDPEKILASIVRQFSSPAPGKPLLQPIIAAYQLQKNKRFPINLL
ncbi:hypothetical protein F5Y03DRAFT_389192 [Xylaria venustula]|nr:hypothetical protein F5Y03DRAFT_389192 [Xylaria venustula]